MQEHAPVQLDRPNVSGQATQTIGFSPFPRPLGARSLSCVITYRIEAYVADVELADVPARVEATAAAMSEEGHAIRYVRSLLLHADETCFHLVEATSEASVAELARRAHLGHERIVEAEESSSSGTGDRAQPHPTEGEQT
jgi:hypothetical protein